jgi:hypothetical protein
MFLNASPTGARPFAGKSASVYNMGGGDYFGVSDGQTGVIPGQKSAWGKRPAVECRPSPEFPEARLWPTSELPTTHQPRPRHYGRELGQNVDVPKRKITSAELC